MIAVFVSKEGYYIHGDGVEAALRCSPALDSEGNPIFHELHHTYKVMFLALQLIAKKASIQGDIIIYNDSRIIDELNGSVPPLDEVCERWRQVIRREIIPHIRSIVTFKKRAQDFIASKITGGDSLLVIHEPERLKQLVDKATEWQLERNLKTKKSVLSRFKGMWRNDK